MSFLDALNGGLEKASETAQKCRQVDSVFNDMNTEIDSFTGPNVSVLRGATVIAGMRGFLEKDKDGNSADAYFIEDILNLLVTAGPDYTAVARVAGWRQSINGWPCTVSFEGQEVVCFTKAELEGTLQELLSSSSFGRALADLIQRVQGRPSPI